MGGGGAAVRGIVRMAVQTRYLSTPSKSNNPLATSCLLKETQQKAKKNSERTIVNRNNRKQGETQRTSLETGATESKKEHSENPRKQEQQKAWKNTERTSGNGNNRNKHQSIIQ